MKHLILGLWLSLMTVSLHAAEGHHHSMQQSFRGCQGLTQPSCGLRPSPAFDTQGRLWLAWVDGGHVYVSRSDDLGRHFTAPVVVNRIPETIEASGESRAKIAIGQHGEVYISYTQKLAKRFTGNIRFSRSLDGGLHFSDPVTVNDNHEVIGHRFDTLWVAPDNRVYLLWIDKRDREAANKQGREYHGAAIYYAISRDGGKRFGDNRKLAEHSCECCRIALAGDGQGAVAIWRHIFGRNTRDHVLGRVGEDSKPIRVSEDDWKVDACPHHGPALAIGEDGRQHVAWYTQGTRRQGLFYARRSIGDKEFSTPMALGNRTHAAGHASIVTVAREVFIVWREFDGQRYRIQLMHSRDDGMHWSEPRSAAQTEGDADYPFLLKRGDEVFLAWQSAREGYRLLKVSS